MKKSINIINFLLHVILGTGIALMLTCYERQFALQFLFSIIFGLVIAAFGEKGQEIVFKSKPSMQDVIAGGLIGGFLGWLIHSFTYGFHLLSEDVVNDAFLSSQFFIGLGMVLLSSTIWVISEFIIKKKKIA